MKALVQENRVFQIEENEFPVAPSLTWVDCGDDVETGWTYDGSSFSAPPAATIEEVRGQRNILLLTSDWTVLPDSALSDEKKSEWQVFRQALRDVPNTYPNITWPNAPD